MNTKETMCKDCVNYYEEELWEDGICCIEGGCWDNLPLDTGNCKNFKSKESEEE